MKTTILILLLSPCLLLAQEAKPFKGASKIITQYPISGDSLFHTISQSLIDAGYTIEKRDKELMYIVTDDKPIKHLNYKMRAVIKGNRVEYTAKWMSNVNMTLGNWRTESSYEQVKLTSGMYVTRDVFIDMDKFVKATTPLIITYSK